MKKNQTPMVGLRVAALTLTAAISATAQIVTIDPTTQRFIGGISDLDRTKYFKIHSGASANDAEMQQFFSDYNVTPGRGFWGPFSYAKSQTGAVGQYPAPRSGNPSLNGVVSGYVATEHPASVIRYNLDKNAAADWVVEYYKNFVGQNSLPEYFEPMNEPFVHSDDAVFAEQQPNALLMRERMSEWFAAIGEKIHQTPALANMKVLGYSSAWPSFARGNFSVWNGNQKLFMDVAGEHMDGFSTHLYDGINVVGVSGERSGSNSEAILDMIEAYSFLKWGEIKPHAITEYGGIASGYPEGYSDLVAVQSVSANNKILFNLLDRTDRLLTSIPFTTDKSTWHLTAANNYQPYGAALFVPTNIGDPVPAGWVYTPKVLFYEMWKNVQGKRVDIKSNHPDIQSHAFLDGNKLYVGLNNLDEFAHSVSLDFAASLPGLQSLNVKRLRIYPDLPHEFTEETQTSAPGSITMVEDETVVLEYTFQSNINFSNAIRSNTYYTNKYLQPISANTAVSFGFSGVQTGSGMAKIKMGIGRNPSASKKPIVMLNGTAVEVPDNWKGYDQASSPEFFGVIEIPVPMSLLLASNTVSIEFPDSGGHISSVVLEVGKYDSAPASNQSPYGGLVQTIPGTIEAGRYDVGGEGISFHDSTNGNSGGQSRSDNVDLGSDGGDVFVGWVTPGEWLEYTVDAAGGTYDLVANVTCPGDGKTVVVKLDGAVLGTFALPNTGGWSNYQPLTLKNIIVPGGNNQTLRLEFPEGGLNIKSVAFNAVAPSSFSYDFGRTDSPVAEGYTRVTSATAKGSGTYGWTSTSGLGTRDRGGNRSAINRDIVFSSQTRTFSQDIPNGTYRVAVTIGDQYATDQVTVKAEGVTMASNIARSPNQYEDVSFPVEVTDGALDIEFSDTGGDSSVWTINAVVIAPETSFKHDFGTSSSVVAVDHTRVSPATLAGTFGWVNASSIGSRDRGAGGARTSATRDLVFSSQPRVFSQQIPNGTYTVTVTIGDVYAVDDIVIKAEGVTKLANIDRAANQYGSAQFSVTVSDGILNVEFSDAGGSNPNWIVNSITIE